MLRIIIMCIILLTATVAEAGELVSSVLITNTGDEPAHNVIVKIPLYHSGSIYQRTTLIAGETEYDYIIHKIDTIPAGATRTIIARYDVKHFRIGYRRNNEYWLAKSIYDAMPKTGNCRDLALEYIRRCEQAGLTAREVVGYARPTRKLTAGSLAGTRHSWAEVSVSGRWMPVDLTFNLFGRVMTNHLIEGYTDRSIRISYTGGKLSAFWNNDWHE